MEKAVFFDIDNTVYNYTNGDREAMQALKSYCFSALGISGEEFTEYIKKAHKILAGRLGTSCASIHNRLIRFQCMLELMHQPIFPHAYKMYSLYWDKVIDTAVLEPGIMELMAGLKSRGIFVGIGTNMTADIQYRKILKLGFGNYIDGIVTSEEAGTEKPDPKFFLLCAEKAQAKPGECVFIGDSLEHDVKGAQSAGMQAVLYCPGNDGIPKNLPCTIIRSFTSILI